MFPSPLTGEMYHPDSVVNLHKKILKDAGLEHLRFHDLRHTFATTALQNGVLHAGPLRRWVHSTGLHPRHSPEAGRGGCRHGQLHGAGPINIERKMRRTGSPSSCPALLCPLFPLSHFRVWVTVWVKPLTHILTHAVLSLFTTKNPQKPKFSGIFEKSLQSEYFQILCKRTELHPPGLLAGGASAPYKRFHRR